MSERINQSELPPHAESSRSLNLGQPAVESIREHRLRSALAIVAVGAVGAVAVAPYPSTNVEAENTRIPHSATAYPTPLPKHAARQPKLGHNQPEPVLSRFPRTIAWYANFPNGYVTGNETRKDSIQDAGKKYNYTDYKGRLWKLGRMIHAGHSSDNECAWILASKAKKIYTVQRPGICLSDVKKMQDRSLLLSDANGAKHEYEGGSYTPMRVKEECTENSLYLNYNQKEKRAYDRLPLHRKKLKSGIHWRYVTKDGRKVVGQVNIHVKQSGEMRRIPLWAVVSRGCLPEKLAHNGPPKR